MTTVAIYMPQRSTITGDKLVLTKSDDFAVLNGAGDALTESGTSGWFTCDVAEPWTVRLGAAVVDSGGLVPVSGSLAVGATIVADGVAALDAATQTQITEIKAKTDNLPSDPADQSAIEAAITSATSVLATAANLATVAGYIDTEVAAIKAKTDNLPSDPADASVIAASFAALNDVSAAEVADEVRVELASELAMIADIPTNSELATALLPLATQAYIEASILTFVTEAY